MIIIIDAMGGDNAPDEIVKGAVDAFSQYNVKIILTGDREKIEKTASDNGLSLSGIEIVHTDVAVTMDDEPASVVRSKKSSSMSIGLNLLKQKGDAFVSAGNTGALHTGSTLIIKKIPGIHRSAITTIFPFEHPMLMIDSGANINVTSEYLEQWAMMGSIYMKKLYNIESPKIGLLNNGTEEHKGTEIMTDTYKRLSQSYQKLNFIGNVEGKEIPFGRCDVLVTDGFTGNIVLKLVEGMGKFMFATLKDMYMTNALTKVSYLVMKDQLKGLKKNFDASEHGGAPLMGLSKPVIKAHGSSDARAIKNAVRQAVSFVKSGMIEEITAEAKKYTETSITES